MDSTIDDVEQFNDVSGKVIDAVTTLYYGSSGVTCAQSVNTASSVVSQIQQIPQLAPSLGGGNTKVHARSIGYAAKGAREAEEDKEGKASDRLADTATFLRNKYLEHRQRKFERELGGRHSERAEAHLKHLKTALDPAHVKSFEQKVHKIHGDLSSAFNDLKHDA
jgi:hypothetical protein